jgi:hypothetical protein
MAITPLLMTAVGAGVQGMQAKNAGDYNSKVLAGESAVSGMQSNEATLTQLRQGDKAMGRSTAAAVESGGGVQGSTGAVLHQSGVNAELDALNVRYAGLLRQDSYTTQSTLDKRQGQDAMASDFLSGAGNLLKQKYGAQTGTYSPGYS